MLVVLEVALTLVLLVSAGLLANSFLRLQNTDPGFAADEVVMVEFPLPQGRYPDGQRQAAFYQELLDRLATRGELQGAAVAFPNPLEGQNATGSFYIDGKPSLDKAEQAACVDCFGFAAVSQDDGDSPSIRKALYRQRP